MKHVFSVVRGSELPTLVKMFKEIRVIPLEEDEPVMTILNESNLEDLEEDALYLVIMSARNVPAPHQRPAEGKREEKREAVKPKERPLIDHIYEKVKWALTEFSERLPFVVTDIVKERDEDTGLWTLKFRLEKKGIVTTSVQGAAKLIVNHVMKIMSQEKFPEPILVVISMEGKVLYLIADIVLDEIVKAILASKGLVLKDYVILVDVANNMVEVTILAEKSPEAKVGIFSGYKVAEEIAKVVKERLKTNMKVKVRLKVGLFDYVKII